MFVLSARLAEVITASHPRSHSVSGCPPCALLYFPLFCDFPLFPCQITLLFHQWLSLNSQQLPPGTTGTLIAARDSHSYCVLCMGLNHAEEAIDLPENCSHCLVLPKKRQCHRLKVISVIPSSVKPQTDTPAALPRLVLFEACERPAAHLNIEWPALQSASDQVRMPMTGNFWDPLSALESRFSWSSLHVLNT